MSGHDNPTFVGDELNLKYAEENGDDFRLRADPDQAARQKSRRKSTSTRPSQKSRSSLDESSGVKSKKNSVSEKPVNYTPTYFPQSRPSISEDKSVCTINIKPLRAPDDPSAAKEPSGPAPIDEADPSSPRERDQWGNSLEFLMSCIAMSVGLGNVWRFPFTALENGGGAFLIPYLIVLVLVGRPIYYLEMVIGQFSSRGSVKVYDLSPAMRGVGYGQLIATICLATYYASVMATIGIFLVNSFRDPLPWSQCDPSWTNCIDSQGNIQLKANNAIEDPISDLLPNMTAVTAKQDDNNRISTSAELYFLREVLKEKTNIDDGIGAPDLYLSLSLGVAWLVIMLVLIKGIKSSGKASYFLALFPYVIIGVLLIRSVTLPGAHIGIVYFFKPQWDKILEPQVWYAAVSQVFFSLSVCFGNIIMYSSFNKFRHNVYRDATIVATLDTFTSIISGCTIFGILGNLAHEMGTDNINDVVVPGPGLAFISYPEAIAKFSWLPQLFSVLFFLMLFILGIGSNIAMASCIITVLRDQFPKVKAWQAAIGVSVTGFLLGLVYVTPGGQMILNLVDYFGASTIVYVLAIGELVAIMWIYGLNRFCRDLEFMLNRRPSWYWRLSWGIVTPGIMIIIFIYALITLQPLEYKGNLYPTAAYVCGWLLAAFGILQLPIWAVVAISRQDEKTLLDMIKSAFRPTRNWGPKEKRFKDGYYEFIEHDNRRCAHFNQNWTCRAKRWMFG